MMIGGFVLINIFFPFNNSMAFVAIMVGVFSFGYWSYAIRIGKIIGTKGSRRHPRGIEYTKFGDPIRFWFTVIIYLVLGGLCMLGGIILFFAM